MSNADREPQAPIKKIEITSDGPYMVPAGIPLVRKTQVVSEYGEPLTWKKEDPIETNGDYCLCRCGKSGSKPFCDGTHHDIDFDGTESSDNHLTAARQVKLPGGTHIVVKRDYSLCMESGFCGNRKTNIDGMIHQTGDTQVRSQVMAMVERCPSGSYVYSIEPGGANIEPDLPQEVALTTEITSQGPIEGPYWITGGIPVERSDGKQLEVRNRVTLCNCGHSSNKPLCDGTHRHLTK
jgi:CDGSH-type Zn-finger protein